MRIHLNRLQCRTFQKFIKKVDFQAFSLEYKYEDMDDDTVIVRLTDANDWELTIEIGDLGRVLNASKARVDENQQIQPQHP